MMWLCEHHPNKRCPIRQQVACEIIDGRALDLDGNKEFNALQLLEHDHLGPLVRACALNGTVHIDLWRFGAGIRRRFAADTQRNEGANKEVQNAVNSAPNVELPELSSTFTTTQQSMIGLLRSGWPPVLRCQSSK